MKKEKKKARCEENTAELPFQTAERSDLPSPQSCLNLWCQFKRYCEISQRDIFTSKSMLFILFLSVDFFQGGGGGGMCVFVHVCVCVCAYMNACVCVCVCAYMHVSVY